ncbi:PAS domain S-box protein [Pseudomonas sp. M30-35]|uniref:PAS domain S-box protein n=1 Tax=Pseudomonas sp. M30-35 TaxID=1981174 RepID=UPI000B3BDE7E|nr:PAS domain S-box protein [Pseudomonas sp. M30-35]ARU89119.1 sensory box protein [Pseudomonas sp. M30-35]
MAKNHDRSVILPHIPALDPAAFEQAWDDAPRLLAALNGAKLGAWLWDIESGKISWSRGAQALYGLDASRPLKQRVEYLDLVPPEDHEHVLSLFRKIVDGTPDLRPMRHRIIWPDGSLHWIEVNGSLKPDSQNRPRMYGVVRDYTAQKQRSESLINSEQRFASLFQLNPDIVMLVRLADDHLIEVNQHFEHTFGWTAAETIGRSCDELNIWVHEAEQQYLARAIADVREPIVQQVQLRTRTGSILDGVLSSQYLELESQAFMLSSFTDTSQQKRAEEALRSSEEKFSKAFQYSPDAVVITDLSSGRFIEVNPSFERQFGWSKSEAVGHTSIELGIWADLSDRQRMLDAVKRNELNELEVCLHSRDGKMSTNLLFGGEIILEGRACLILTVRDISRQRAQEQVLNDSQERLNLALDSADLGTWDWHIPSNLIYGSERTSILHGLTATPYHGDFETLLSTVPLEDQRMMLKAYKELLSGARQTYQVIYRSRHANGATYYIESTAKLYRDTDGSPLRMTGILLNITERVHREQRLAASEEKFATLFQASPDPICVTRVSDGVFIDVNPKFSKTFGWESADIINRSSLDICFWKNQSDRERLYQKLNREQSLDEEVAHFYHHSGALLTCAISTRFIRVDRRLCISTTFRDITERELSEAALRASQEKFAKAFHSSPDAITITERDSGRYIEVNEGFCKLTGYSAEDVIGKTAYELNIWANAEERQMMLTNLAHNGHVHHLEMRGKHRNGTQRIVEVSVETIELNETPCLLLTARDVSELKSAQAQVQHMAYHDPLTNLPNRTLLMDRLTQQIALLKRHNLRGALLFIDLDHFKHINDSLGHPVGDNVLRVITARLEASVRQEDTVARLGGDEFVILISGLEGSTEDVTLQVTEISNQLRKLLAEPMLLDGQRLQVTPSIGIALIPDHGDTPADLLKRADIALYRAKDSGRNIVQLFRNSMQEAASERLRLENDLRLAYARGEFELYFQPQVDARTNKIIGAEALIRWDHPTLGPQSPGLFIYILEESGLILEVGGWVLAQACRVYSQLFQEGLLADDNFSLCVNISPRQFRQEEFVALVHNCLRAENVPRLKLEVTESIIIQNIDDTIKKMNQLRDIGVSFAMDDFGTGYSSLTYLKRLPVDVLKIDQSFIRDATSDPNDAEIIRAILAMANSLGLTVIAEGVEQQEQLDFLGNQGCHLYQGYLFSKPVPLNEFKALLQRSPEQQKRS